MKKAEADERLTGMGNKDGNFLVRGPEDKRVLSVVYKGAPTHHLVKVGEDGNLVLNKRAFGTTPSIAVLVETLKTAQKGWPVPLSGFYANPDESPPPAPAPAPAAAAPATKEQAAPPAAAEADAADNDDPAPKDDSGADSAGESALPATHSATTEETSFGAPPPVPGRSAVQGPPAVVVVPTAYEDTASLASINGLGNSAAALPPWLHFSIQDTEAQQLLESAGLTDGLFLVRPTVQESYVLDLVVRGMVTHHLIQQDAATGRTTVNGGAIGGGTLVELIDVLSEPHGKWPCKLQTYIANDGSNTSVAVVPPVKAAVITEGESKAAAGTVTGMHGAGGGGEDPDAPAQWKCGECGTTNEDLEGAAQSNAPRTCISCGKKRARRRAGAEAPEPHSGGGGAAGGEAMPQPSAHAEEARQNLHEAIQILSAYRQQKLYEVLAKYVNRKWPLASMVTGLATVISKLDDKEKVKVEFAVGKLIPKSAKTEYYSMLDRYKREQEMSIILAAVQSDEQAFLVRYVMQGLQALKGDPRKLEEIGTFERRIHHASTMRGWAALKLQAQESKDNFDIELIAKHVHIGWARAIVSEWDPMYGLEPVGQVITRDDGLMDTYNFESTHGYQLYCDRIKLAGQRYLLPGESRAKVPAEVPILPDSQKHNYRAAAEILLHAYFVQNPGPAYTRGVDRVDEFAIVELKQLGIVQQPPKPTKPKPLNKFQKSMLLVRGQGSLTGKVSSVLTPRFNLPGQQPDGGGEKFVSASDMALVVVDVQIPLGIMLDGNAASGCFVANCKRGGNAAQTGEVLPGMKVVSVNGAEVAGLDKPAVVAKVNQSPEGICALGLQMDEAGYQRYKASGQAALPSYENIDAEGEPQQQQPKWVEPKQRPVWFHGELAKPTATSVLEIEKDGTFLVRQRVQKDEIALAVKSGGAVTHHLIGKSPEGSLMIGALELEDVKSLTELIDALRLPWEGWPQVLTAFVPHPGCTQKQLDSEKAHVEDLMADKDCSHCNGRFLTHEGALDRSDNCWYCDSCWDKYDMQLHLEAQRQAEIAAEAERVRLEEEAAREQERLAAEAALEASVPAADAVDWNDANITVAKGMRSGLLSSSMVVVLDKNASEGGYGVTLEGPKTEEEAAANPGITVKKVKAKSAAALVPDLEGATILKLNGQDVQLSTKKQCMSIIRKSEYDKCEVEYVPSVAAGVSSFGAVEEDGEEAYGMVHAFGARRPSTIVAADKPGAAAAGNSGDGGINYGQGAPDGDNVYGGDSNQYLEPQLLDDYETLDVEPVVEGGAPAAAASDTSTVKIVPPLGMSFDGNPGIGFFVTKIKPGGAAEASSRIHASMKILSVNGSSIAGLAKKEVTGHFKATPAGSECTIEFQKNPSTDAAFAAFAGKPADAAAPVAAAPAATPEKPKRKAKGSTTKKQEPEKAQAEGGAPAAGDPLYDPMSPGNACNECGKDESVTGALSHDPADGNTYCTPCWEKFYGAGTAPGGAAGAGEETKKKKKKKKKAGPGLTAADVGKTCSVEGYDCKGTIRFVGPHAEDGKEKVGVELMEALGKHNGTSKGHTYFKCANKCGLLVAPNKVELAKVAKADGKCAYSSANGNCRAMAIGGTAHCEKHTCGFNGCDNVKGSRDALCALHLQQEANGEPLHMPEKAQAKPKKKKASKKSAKGGGTISVTCGLPIGMSFDGTASHGYYVKSAKPGGNAAATGKVEPGLRIISCNGTLLAGMDKKQVVAVVKSSQGQCLLEFKKDAEGLAAYQNRHSNGGGGGADQAPAAVEDRMASQMAEMESAMGGFASPTAPVDQIDYGNADYNAEQVDYAEIPAAKVDYAEQMPTQVDYAEAAPPAGGGVDISTFGKMKLISFLRKAGADYKQANGDIDALRTLAYAADRASSGLAGSGGQELYANALPASTPAAAERAQAPAPPPPRAAAASGAEPAAIGDGLPQAQGTDYESMGRLKLVKLCKEQGLDYSGVAKDKPGLIRLLRAATL